MNRNLDGVYIRVQRGDHYASVCYTDLTDDEAVQMLQGRETAWLSSMCLILRNVIRELGEKFDIYNDIDGEYATEEETT